MYAPTTVSVGPIRSQKGRGVRKSKKGTTKRKRKSIKYKKKVQLKEKERVVTIKNIKST